MCVSLFQDKPDTAELKKVEAPAEAFSAEMKFEGKLLQRPDIAEDVLRNVPSALCEMEEGLVDVSQVLPWQKNVVAPSRVPTEDLSEPPDALQLEFLYGFTADISREVGEWVGGTKIVQLVVRGCSFPSLSLCVYVPCSLCCTRPRASCSSSARRPLRAWTRSSARSGFTRSTALP